MQMHSVSIHQSSSNVAPEVSIATLRLMQLVSPSLPVGGFTYSQGLEWAVDHQWIKNNSELSQWLQEQLNTTLSGVDFPILLRMYNAVQNLDNAAFDLWSRILIASRETNELRQEEYNRGRAMCSLLQKLGLLEDPDLVPIIKRCQAAGFALAANRWEIPENNMLLGYGWSWLENLVLAGVKIIPLGQSDGQMMLQDLIPQIPDAIEKARLVTDKRIGAGSPALSIASSQHQFQYTRLFRS